MAEQVPSNRGTVPVVVSSVGNPTTCIVTPVQAPGLQLASSANPQVVVQSPQQQQVLILPGGATTIPQSQLSQITVRQPAAAAQNNLQILGQQRTAVQVINQPTNGPVAVVSQGQPGSGSQMIYIVSPTRSVTAANPQGPIPTASKVLLSPPPSSQTRVEVKAQGPAIQATQPTVVIRSPQSLGAAQTLQQSRNTGPLVASSSPNVLSGLATAGRSLPAVQVSQGKPLIATQGVSSATPGVITPQTANVVIGHNRAGSQPVTLQLKITDPALLQKLGMSQGKINLSGMNLSNLLASQKVQLVGQNKILKSTGGAIQSGVGRGVKIVGANAVGGATTAAGNSINIINRVGTTGQTVKIASSVAPGLSLTQGGVGQPVTIPNISRSPTPATSSTVRKLAGNSPTIVSASSQPQVVAASSNEQQLVTAAQLAQPSPAVVGSPQAGTKPVMVQAGQKASLAAGTGASFVIGNRQISNIVPQASLQTGSPNVDSLQKRVTLSPRSSVGKTKSVNQTVIFRSELNKPAVSNLASKLEAEASPVPKKVVTIPGISAVNAGLKAVSAATSNSSSTVSSTNKVTSPPSSVPVNSKPEKEPAVIRKLVIPAVSSLAQSTASPTSSTVVKPVTSSGTSASGQSYVSKFIKVVPPKPGQKQTQMVISVNPNTDVNGEVKAISSELAQLQGQPKTHDTLKKLQDLQTRLQQLQMVTQLIKKAKQMNQQGASSGSKTSTIPGIADTPADTKERKKIIKQHKLQEKANRIVAEAVQKAKAAGKVDIPNVNDLKMPPLPDGAAATVDVEEEKRKKKKDKSRSKSKKSKDSKKDKKRDKERKQQPPKKKPPKKLPAAAILKLKRQKRKRGEDCSDSSDFDETPPRSPGKTSIDPDAELLQRRSARNTTRKKYTEDYDFKITDDESSSSSDDEGKEKKDKKKGKAPPSIQTKPGPPAPVSKAPKPKPVVDADSLEVDVESIDPVVASQGTQFFVENPDEDEANIIEKILTFRTRKKPPLPGEAQVGELEEFYVKYRNFSYLHCEWQTVDKIKDPRIHQKVKRFKQKLQQMSPIAIQQMEEEPFNPDFIQVDRILDKAVTEEDGTEVTHYLVKWASLPYEDSTWELAKDVEGVKVDFFHRFQDPPPPEKRVWKFKAKPADWKKLTASPNYKDGNTLRDYQLEGVNWLMFSWCNGQNCILADEMGLGKTIQSIGFLTQVIKYGINGPFLVIAPLSTITNWQREFETWTDLNAVVYHGSAQSRHMIAEFEMFYKDENAVKIPNCFRFHVLITTYEILLADCQELSEIEWRAVVIDEAHRLKNRNCKLLEGLKILDVEHRVLLTGTPLQNNVEELFSLLNFLEPGRFRSLVQFMGDFGDLKTEGQVERLQQLLKPMMLRRLKEDVEKNLAPKEETIVEVELTSIQKRYYRAILERNFSFLQKGANSTTNLPNLMNTMMELRKCCNHPFLINGAEEQILLEMNSQSDQTWNEPIHLRALTQSSGKMVLLDKLLPKLKEGGHRVLIFSQMIRCLDILEDYLLQKRYLFERIDGRVRGNLRQAAIDRFSKPDSDRFIFLLCTRAGGLGINLTAADTCIIFDSDWNPQNDLQAQARCHRIGQKKAVKIYRLITRNSYEREMFDKASMKLGLDKAVLQSMRGDKDAVSAQQPLSKTEVEDLLRKGAYGAIMEDDEASSKFCEEDIEMILRRRTKVIQIESGVKGSTFAKASFTVASDHADIKIDDPDFWQKWAKKADITIKDAKEEKIMMAPRQRKQTRRYGGNEMTELSSSDEEVAPPKEEKPSKKQLQSGWTRLECFRVEKGLLTFGWGCWTEIISTTRFRRRLGEKDIEAISRTMLIYCLQYYKGDENIKSFIWDLVTPSQDGTPRDVKQHKGLSVLVPRGGRKSKKPKKEESMLPCIVEFDFNNKDKNAEQLLNDNGYKNHLKRHCNKVLLRVRLLFYLRHEIIGPAMARQIEEGTPASELTMNIPPPEGEKPIGWWDTECDKSLLIGVFKHGYEKYHFMRIDPGLCFLDRCGMPRLDEIPTQSQDSDPMLNDSQLEVEAMEQDQPALPKHIKEEAEMESPGSTRPSSPATQNTSKRKSANLVPSEPGKLPFPQAPDLNTRVRRLVAGFQREQKKKQLKEAKREKKDKVRKLRMAEQQRLREMRKVEGAQKWSRREESDFYRILAAFGVEVDMATGKYDWTTFKKLAKLERKYDHRMQEFYEHYRVMCLKVCKREEEIPPDYAEKPPLDFQIEPISEERASKCLQRIDLLLKVRTEVLPHQELHERLQLCQKSVELPEWWEPAKHDKDLLIGVSRYGINRMESQQMMMNDLELSFKELKEKYPQMGMPPPGAFTKAKGEGKKKKKAAKSKNTATGGKQAAGQSGNPQGPSGPGDQTGEYQGDTAAPKDGIGMVELKKPPEDMVVKTETSQSGLPEVVVKSEEKLEGQDAGNSQSSEGEQKPVMMAEGSNGAAKVKVESMPPEVGGLLPAVKEEVVGRDSQGVQVSSQVKEEAVTNHPPSGGEGPAVCGDVKSEQKEPSSSSDGRPSESVPPEQSQNGTGMETGGDLKAEQVNSSTIAEGEKGSDGTEGSTKPAEGKAQNGEAATKPAKQMSEAEILYTYILRWPKDRVIVHRLEQISTCVLKGVWPGRKHNPPPPPPPPDAGLPERPPMEHSYAGGFMGSQYMEMDEPIPIKKKKKKRKPASETEPRTDSGSYEVYRLLAGADSQGDGDLMKKRKRKEGVMGPEMEQREGEVKPPRKRKRKEKLKAIDPLTGLPIVPEEPLQEVVLSAPPPKRRKRLKDPATLNLDEITGEEKVGIVEKSSGYVLPAKRVPLLKDVAEWIMKHPRYLIAFEWGEIVIKKGFIPPEMYDRISKVPSHQMIPPFAPYKTRATATTEVPDGPCLQAPPVSTSVPLAPSLPIPIKPSPHMEQSIKLKKKLKEKVSGRVDAMPAEGVAGVAPPVVPSQLSGISSYLIPSSGGVYISPYLASQRMVHPSGGVVASTRVTGPVGSTLGPVGLVEGPVRTELITDSREREVREEEVVDEMEVPEDDSMEPTQEDEEGNGSDDSSSIDDNDYNMLMNSDIEGFPEGMQDSDNASSDGQAQYDENEDSRKAFDVERRSDEEDYDENQVEEEIDGDEDDDDDDDDDDGQGGYDDDEIDDDEGQAAYDDKYDIDDDDDDGYDDTREYQGGDSDDDDDNDDDSYNNIPDEADPFREDKQGDDDSSNDDSEDSDDDDD